MFVVAAQFLIGLVFVAAVLGKATDYPAFVASVGDLRLRPAAPLAALVLAGEIGVVALLAIRPAAGFGLAALLLAAFAVAITGALRRGDTKPCRCFGRSTTPLGRHHVWRNAFLIAVAALGALATAVPADLATAGPAGPAVAVLAAVAGLIAGGLIVMLDDLRFLFT
jgi:uncharacterized membrane protein YphA (DoxX/SURF4 family)